MPFWLVPAFRDKAFLRETRKEGIKIILYSGIRQNILIGILVLEFLPRAGLHHTCTAKYFALTKSKPVFWN